MTKRSMRLAGVVVAGCMLAAGATRADNYSVLREFQGGSDAAFATASLMKMGPTLYGTTSGGGSDGNFGTVFSMTPTGIETVVHSFQGGSDGAYPEAGLIDVHGTLYGTTQNGGGVGNLGTVYSVTKAGVETVLHAFKGSADGAWPFGGLINVAGTLYGTTSAGGAYGNGTVFSVTPAGVATVLHSFLGGNDGAAPQSSLIAVGGKLYGTTSAGGSYDAGTVFSVTPTGAENVVYVFHGGTDNGDGVDPMGGLIEVGGKLYGTTRAGGANNAGMVFSVTTKGHETVVYSFARNGSDGAIPFAGLIDIGGTLYGTTYVGGTGTKCSGRGCGTVFSLTAEGAETVLHSFGGSDGAYVYGGLLNVKGRLYGTTLGGGAGACAIGDVIGCGVVFSLTP
jgi:uncharacterized repeat protein (TIGR03803 family)